VTDPKDLPEDVVRRLDALYERLATIDHYTLLGLSRTATRAQVRQAFLAMAPQFHPDKYFGRTLGPYAAKMQRVFAQLSVAHDTLVNDERRAEYTRGLPPPLPPAPGPPASERHPSSPASGNASEPFGSTAFSSSTVRAATPVSQIATDAARARQQAFASRLAGHSSTRMRAGTPVTAFNASGTPGKPFAPGEGPRRTSSTTTPAVDPKMAVDALKRRYEESLAQARGKQTTTGTVSAAETAAAKAEQHTAAMARAKESEQKQEYGAAGVDWARAFDLMPAADVAHRASLCFRRSGGDPRRAAKYGEEAVKLDPNKASYRVNLALVYLDLGLGLRARGEIDRAHALEPQNAQVKEAMTRIRAMK
jgi:curved DNA-binding protein CbpA